MKEKADSVSLNNKYERKTTNNKLIVTSADPLADQLAAFLYALRTPRARSRNIDTVTTDAVDSAAD